MHLYRMYARICIYAVVQTMLLAAAPPQVRVEKNNGIVNALNRSKTEASPDLQALQEERAAEIRREQKAVRKQQEQAEKIARRQAEEDKRMRSYDSLFDEGKMAGSTNVSNPYGASEDQSSAVAFEDDFM
eukprot:TRINITY_DN2448_c0_g1_i2.p2 TRINITY_DN2448_c0_g1~~TRINITY_DN2448_c0_g1_i2.p2  ORF type:complete len:130 (-),score=33.37 TRINITY_DN2448_c0_g1_i2:117-506(-)